MDILNEISLFLQTSVQMGTHILFAIVGGIICERVGNMNLGIEGMMLMGAAVGFSRILQNALLFCRDSVIVKKDLLL